MVSLLAFNASSLLISEFFFFFVNMCVCLCAQAEKSFFSCLIIFLLHRRLEKTLRNLKDAFLSISGCDVSHCFTFPVDLTHLSLHLSFAAVSSPGLWGNQLFCQSLDKFIYYMATEQKERLIVMILLWSLFPRPHSLSLTLFRFSPNCPFDS